MMLPDWSRSSLLAELQACNFVKRETLAHVFSCKFCEISKNTFPYRTPLLADPVLFTFQMC